MLRKIRDFLDGNEGVDGVALGLKNGDGSYQNLRLKILKLGKHSPLEPTRATFVGTGNLLIRKAVIEKIGMFDENYFAGNEDMDLSYRLKKAGGRLVYRPELFVNHLHIYRDRKSGWLDFLVARRLSDLYFTKKFFPLLLGLERMYAYRNIMKRTGNTVDTFTAMKIKALFRLKTDSNYDIQRSLVSRGLHRTHELFIEGKTIAPADPALASPAARGGGAAARSVRDSVLEKHSLRRALEGYRPIERLVFDFHLTDKTVHEISFNLGINERIVESMISKFMPAVASRTVGEEYAPA
jgi:hypothetical protein